jgi:hypothetical protein
MKTRLILLLTVLLLFLPACGPSAPDLGCAATVEALNALRQGLQQPPEHLLSESAVENGTEFDPNEYFKVFTHLSMEDGYVLDFVYDYDSIGGHPVIFARRMEWEPFNSMADVRPGMDNYLDHVRVDGTPEGYLQYTMLTVTAEQFYLYWHAAYNDMEIVCNPTTVRNYVKALQTGRYGNTMTPEARKQALAIKQVEPSVTIGEDTVEVRIVTFTKWGGFYRMTFTISREFPHYVLDVQQEILAPYNCGIAF